MDHQQDAVWSSALWTQHRSRARFPWLHFRTGIKAISNWCLVSFCSIAAILAKTLGTVMQYSWFSVISGCPYKTVQPFKKYLAVLPRHTRYKVETENNSGYTRPSLFVGWGRGWACVIWREPLLCQWNVQDFCPWLKVRTPQFENSLLDWDPAVSQDVRMNDWMNGSLFNLGIDEVG